MSKVRLFGHSMLWVFTVSIAVLAMMLLVAKFFAAQVPDYKHDLERYLSEEIGAQVGIDDLSATMMGLQPQIRLLGITLDELKKQTNTLSIGEIRLLFNPLDFLTGKINPSKITIVNTNLSIKRFADGHLSINGLANNQADDSSSSDFSWLLEDGNFEVIGSQITWQDGMRDLPDITLKDAHIVFQNTNQEHLLMLQGKLPEHTGDEIVLSIKVVGDILSSNDWRAEGYLNAKKIKIEKYLSYLKIDELSVSNGVGNLELWSHWDSAQLSRAKGSVFLEKVSLVQHERVLDVSQFNSQFDWKKVRGGWALQTKNLSFEVEGSQKENGEFSVKYKMLNDADYQLNIASMGLNLKAISSLVQHSDLLDKKTASILKDVDPSGTLSELSASIVVEGNQTAWAFCGELRDFSNGVYEKVPVIKNLTGKVCSTQNKGWLDINAVDSSVYFKNLFREPIKFNTLNGQLTWLRDDHVLTIDAEQLVVNTPHIATNSRLSVQLPLGGGSPVVDLQTNFAKTDARFIPLYLPVGMMGEGVVNWLDSAFSEGQVTGGGLVLKGMLSEFPYRQQQGVFQVLFDAQGVDLHYADQWPDVLDVSAELEFKNGGMRIVGTKGRISNNDIAEVLVEVGDLGNDNYLNLSGKINDDIGGLYTFFKQSPIKQIMGSLLNQSKVSGQAEIDLNIEIPLRSRLKTRVEAQARLSNNTLTFPNIDVSLENIQGVIKYAEQGLTGKALSGNFLGQQLTVDIHSKKKSTLITAKGLLDTAVLDKVYPSKAWQKVKGKSSAKLLVNLPHSGLTGAGSSSISLSSDLVGIAVDLPAPIGKPLATLLPFELMVSLGQNGLPVKARYGENLKGLFQFNEDKDKSVTLSKGTLHFGAGQAKLPSDKGLQLSGFVKALDVGQWRKALRLDEAKSNTSLLVNQLNIKLGKLNWLGRIFSEVNINSVHKGSQWAGEIDSPLVSGHYVLPDTLGNNEIIHLDLTTLRLPSLNSKGLSETKSPLSPDEIPNINLKSQAFFIGDAELGAIELRLRKKHNGMIIETLSLTSDRDTLQAYGAWELQGKLSRTGLKGQLSSKSMGGLLKDSGIFDDLAGASADVIFDLYWPGEPQEFSKNHLNGYGQIKTSKGKLLDVEPGIGRILGLLSLDTLKRRLQFDFSDLVGKGLSFDKIKGGFTIIDGDARTNHFYLESPSAHIDFDGRVGLGKEDFDQLITVTPKTTESLPIAGALVGGPLVGAAVFIVQKIAGKTVNKFVGYQYRVTGPWSNPKIKQISKPGGKIFGMVDNVLTPVFDATIGQLPLDKLVSTLPSAE
jgi:uncharacterized protein (TIGR02099 family)